MGQRDKCQSLKSGRRSTEHTEAPCSCQSSGSPEVRGSPDCLPRGPGLARRKEGGHNSLDSRGWMAAGMEWNGAKGPDRSKGRAPRPGQV